MKKQIMVSHGGITHSLEDKLDCMNCIEVEIEFLQAVKKAGGKTKFLENLSFEDIIAKPIRIQRKRIKGWKMPENTIYVGRPSKWGNPFKVGKLLDNLYPVTQEQAVAFYRKRMEANRSFRPDLFEDIITKPLRGKNLCCWCKLSEPCHADVLLEMVN